MRHRDASDEQTQLFDEALRSTAVFDGPYRYLLQRTIAVEGPLLAFFGINPSTADAHTDDQTTRRWIAIAKNLRARGYLAANPFAYITTDVGALANVVDPVGPQNPHYLQRAIERADVLVPCWGSRHKLPKPLRSHLDALRTQLHASGKPVRVIGITQSGDPAHPLFISPSTPLRDWRP